MTKIDFPSTPLAPFHETNFDASTGRADRLPRLVITRVDLARGLFSWLVVIAHSLQLARVISHESASVILSRSTQLLTAAAGVGLYWVMGFFVISGYCIQLSLGRLLRSSRTPFRLYCLARASRILPLYYVGFAYAIVVELVIHGHRPGYWSALSTKGIIAQLFVMQACTESFGCYAPSWSITNEAVYYLIYGILTLVLFARGSRAAAWAGMALCICIAGAMAVFVSVHGRSQPALMVMLLFCLGINWFIGALVAINIDRIIRWRAVRNVFRVWPLWLSIVFWLDFAGLLNFHLCHFLLGIVFGLMLASFHLAPSRLHEGVKWDLLAKIAPMLGSLSYPTYLFHGPTIMVVGSLIVRFRLLHDWRLTWLALTVAGIVSGVIGARFAEAPIMAWRSRLLAKKSKQYAFTHVPSVSRLEDPALV